MYGNIFFVSLFSLGSGGGKSEGLGETNEMFLIFTPLPHLPIQKPFLPSSPLSTRLAKCWFIFIQSQIRKRKVLPSWWGDAEATWHLEFSCIESCLDMTVTSCWQFINLSVCWHHWSPYPGLSLSLQLGVFNVPTSEIIHSFINYSYFKLVIFLTENSRKFSRVVNEASRRSGKLLPLPHPSSRESFALN